jgi:hypothetical protein
VPLRQHRHQPIGVTSIMQLFDLFRFGLKLCLQVTRCHLPDIFLARHVLRVLAVGELNICFWCRSGEDPNSYQEGNDYCCRHGQFCHSAFGDIGNKATCTNGPTSLFSLRGMPGYARHQFVT